MTGLLVFAYTAVVRVKENTLQSTAPHSVLNKLMLLLPQPLYHKMGWKLKNSFIWRQGMVVLPWDRSARSMCSWPSLCVRNDGISLCSGASLLSMVHTTHAGHITHWLFAIYPGPTVLWGKGTYLSEHSSGSLLASYSGCLLPEHVCLPPLGQ